MIGGGRYFASAYVTIRVLRHVGTRLPIQLWHLGGELTAHDRSLMEDLDVQCVDADRLRSDRPFRFIDGHWWKGWQLKPYAVMHCPFREVLLLDADCYPVHAPDSLFDWPDYRQSGAVFWPDIESSLVLLRDSDVEAFGVFPFEDLPTESGQLLINKEQCWRELSLAMHYNAQADYTYNILWGDKDTYPVAWRRMHTDYARMHPRSRGTPHGIIHYDQHGDVLFQHRCTAKFTLDEAQFESTPGQVDGKTDCEFQLEGFCQNTLEELRQLRCAQGEARRAATLDARHMRIEVSGQEFAIRQGSEWDESIVRSVFERDEYGLRALAESGVNLRCVVDVGAHLGGFSRLVKSMWPHARVIAFEPADDSADLFERNLEDFHSVELLRAAAWHAGAESVNLSDSGDGNESARFMVEAYEDLSVPPHNVPGSRRSRDRHLPCTRTAGQPHD